MEKTLYAYITKDAKGFRITQIFRDCKMQKLVAIYDCFSSQPRRNQKTINHNCWKYALQFIN